MRFYSVTLVGLIFAVLAGCAPIGPDSGSSELKILYAGSADLTVLFDGEYRTITPGNNHMGVLDIDQSYSIIPSDDLSYCEVSGLSGKTNRNKTQAFIDCQRVTNTISLNLGNRLINEKTETKVSSKKDIIFYKHHSGHTEEIFGFHTEVMLFNDQEVAPDYLEEVYPGSAKNVTNLIHLNSLANGNIEFFTQGSLSYHWGLFRTEFTAEGDFVSVQKLDLISQGENSGVFAVSSDAGFTHFSMTKKGRLISVGYIQDGGWTPITFSFDYGAESNVENQIGVENSRSMDTTWSQSNGDINTAQLNRENTEAYRNEHYYVELDGNSKSDPVLIYDISLGRSFISGFESFVDASGIIHLVWKDSSNTDLMYSYIDGTGLSIPQVIDTEWTTHETPRIVVSDGIKRIFWIDQYQVIKHQQFGRFNSAIIGDGGTSPVRNFLVDLDNRPTDTRWSYQVIEQPTGGFKIAYFSSQPSSLIPEGEEPDRYSNIVLLN